MKNKIIGNIFMFTACMMPLIARWLWWQNRWGWLEGDGAEMTIALCAVCLMFITFIAGMEFKNK